MSAGAAPGADVYAERALRAHAAMQERWGAGGGELARDGLLRRVRFRSGVRAHLWPFIRGLVATLDVTGIRPEHVTPGVVEAAAAARDLLPRRLRALERYWDSGRRPPAYASDVLGRRLGGDRYYDDNAWVGLALVQAERMCPGSVDLGRVQDIFEFARQGWDERGDVPHPGGVFWVEQGRGAGARNHDRNTVSNAPNAQVGLHLALLGGGDVEGDGARLREAALRMYEWVDGTLRDTDGTGLYRDKLRGDGSIDPALWSYNQGSMIGAAVLLQAAGAAARAACLARAIALASAALDHLGPRLHDQPPAFNAIFFRNLLGLVAAADDARLRDRVTGTMRRYADDCWERNRDRHDRLGFSRRRCTLLDQSGMVQVLALLAWDPEDLRRLA